ADARIRIPAFELELQRAYLRVRVQTESRVLCLELFRHRTDARKHPAIFMRLLGLADPARCPAPAVDEPIARFDVRPCRQELAVGRSDAIECVARLFGQGRRERG